MCELAGACATQVNAGCEFDFAVIGEHQEPPHAD